MEPSILQLKGQLLREYYKNFSKYSKGRKPEQKVAWVTAFTPVEILEALGISYYYPESYAAVIAASRGEQVLLQESAKTGLCGDCCSYSCCIEGCLELEKGPRGLPPKPDILIATNNQCNTLPCWWNILARRYQVPLIVLDYPGEMVERENARFYVENQHRDLISALEGLSGNRLDLETLDILIKNSIASVEAWKRVVEFFPFRDIRPTVLFDDISFLITSRCKAETAMLYQMMAQEMEQLPPPESEKIPMFWLGYPLWYHPERFASELLEDFRVTGANYITWWSLDYSGDTALEKLFSAYNYTFLNLAQETRNARLGGLIKESGALCAVSLHNKSCKCDFVSAKDIEIPQAELEIDMIDREFLDVGRARAQIGTLKETIHMEQDRT